MSAFADSGLVSADYVNVRSGPGMDYNVINCLTRGTIIDITDKSNSSWYSISYNGQSGYMASQYISVNNTVTVSADTLSSSKLMTAEEADLYYSSPSPSPEPTPTASPDTVASDSESSNDSTVTPTSSVTPSVEVSSSPDSTSGSTSTQTGRITGDYVRFRTGPGTNYTIITMYNKGQTVSVTASDGDWYKCIINGETGFVSSKYISVSDDSAGNTSNSSSIIETIKSQLASLTSTASDSASSSDSVSDNVSKAGYISGNNVRLRSEPSLYGSIFTELYFGNSVEILGTSDSWTKVSYDGTTGYVYSQYISEGTYSISSSTQNSSSSNATASGQEIADYAMQYLGYKYTYGGKDPSTGFDCSGLVWYVYSHFGYSVNRVASDQALNGTLVSADDLKVGDILCFYSGNSIGHSGIYIGNNKFIHSANSNTGVIITQLSGYYTSRGFIAKRIVC